MTATILELDGQLELYSGLAFDQHLRRRARRGSRPVRARFEARPAIRRPLAEVDLVRRRAMQSRVRPRLVVPRMKCWTSR